MQFEVKKMALYSINDIKFNPKMFQFQVEKIVKTFREYNLHMQQAPFDTQFLSMQLLKYEARHSNMIEGIDTNDIEILAADTPDSKRVSNYVSALRAGHERLRQNPKFSVELICDIHRELFVNMMSIDAINANPGNFRVKYVQIAQHIPPDPQDVPKYIQEFCDWLNDDEMFAEYDRVLGPLVKAAVAHAYFEKVHPFTDGNGRTGRIIFNLVLNKYALTEQPYFYISKAILHDQFEYYQQLAKLDKSNEWQNWIAFFLGLIQYQLEANVKTITEAIKLFYDYKNKLFQEFDPTKREVKRKMFQYIVRYPIFTFTRIYFQVKPVFPSLTDQEFVNIFDEVLEQFDVQKVRDSEVHFEFKPLVKIIVGREW
jgi:Fic family protein